MVNRIFKYLNDLPFIGSVIGAAAVASTIWHYFYKKDRVIKVLNNEGHQHLSLSIWTNRESEVKIKHAKLVRKSLFNSKPMVHKDCYGYLIEHPIDRFLCTQDFELDIKIVPNSAVQHFKIEYRNIAMLYDSFLPYRYDKEVLELRSMTKMITCHIGLYLDSGKIIYIPIPDSFYDYYRNCVGTKYDEDIQMSFETHPRTKYHYTSEDIKIESQKKYMDYYQISRTNFYLLYR